MKIKIVYNSPAFPQYPYDVDINKMYDCQKYGKAYLVQNGDFKREFSLEFIKNFFKVCDGYSWDMLNEIKENTETKISQNKQNKLKKEITKDI